MFHRTVNDVKVLEICEVPPIRTSFIKELGEGAFGKVHKALHQDALEFFKCQHDSSRKRRKQFVAVKELHGGCGRFFFLSDAFFQGRALFKYELRIKAGLKGQGFCYSVRNYKGKIFSTMPKKCGIRNRQNSDNLNFDLLNL